jgi:hypothetical protein
MVAEERPIDDIDLPKGDLAAENEVAARVGDAQEVQQLGLCAGALDGVSGDGRVRGVRKDAGEMSAAFFVEFFQRGKNLPDALYGAKRMFLECPGEVVRLTKCGRYLSFPVPAQRKRKQRPRQGQKGQAEEFQEER